jgi:hypothetical protein
MKCRIIAGERGAAPGPERERRIGRVVQRQELGESGSLIRTR